MLDDGTPCDVLIIGAGPAGSTAAALLAERGRDVVLIEKETHPRFHVGESLLPRNVALLETLGVADQVHEIGVFKRGAEFVSDDYGLQVAFPFSLALNKQYVHSYQVPRAAFDDILFRRACKAGARAFERTRVTDIAFAAAGEPARVTVSGPDGQHVFAARFVLDASGRDTFLANRFGSKISDKQNTTAAVFAHFRGAEQRTGETEGYISVHLVEDGWFWMIPLPDGVTSVGFVGDRSAFKARQGSASDMLAQRIAQSPSVSARMRGAERLSDVRSAGNYSYRSRASWGEGYFMIGDAFAFLDPVFSSGVLLAMTGAERGAHVADVWLDNPRAGRAAARRATRRLRREMDSIAWLIHRINTPTMRSMFMAPSNRFRMRDGLVSILGGNLGGGLRAKLPVWAFKAAFYLLAVTGRTAGDVGRLAPPVGVAAE